ncbi:MAG: hypothetical protein IIA87_05740 [Nanoarchaeota archaeon]|nr:hypothetical protein [Nanoarchaeota archaeon]
MPKKSIKRSKGPKRKTSERIENKILENLIELQKVHTNLAEKFENLSKQISSLLELFETTARSFATQPHIQMAEKDKEFLEKIDKLLEQNKTIAKGLTLMEQKMRDKIYGPITTRFERPQPRQFPKH